MKTILKIAPTLLLSVVILAIQARNASRAREGAITAAAVGGSAVFWPAHRRAIQAYEVPPTATLTKTATATETSLGWTTRDVFCRPDAGSIDGGEADSPVANTSASNAERMRGEDYLIGRSMLHPIYGPIRVQQCDTCYVPCRYGPAGCLMPVSCCDGVVVGWRKADAQIDGDQ